MQAVRLLVSDLNLPVSGRDGSRLPKRLLCHQFRCSVLHMAVIWSVQRKASDQGQDAAQRGHIRGTHAFARELEGCERHLLLG